MNVPDAPAEQEAVALSEDERHSLFIAACPAHAGPDTFICRPCADAQDAVIQRILADRLVAAVQRGREEALGEGTTVTEWNLRSRLGLSFGPRGTTDEHSARMSLEKSSPGRVLITRQRTTYPDRVTEWAEVES